MNVEMTYIASLAGSVLLLAVAIANMNAAIQDWLVTYQLRRRGVTTMATVIGLRWEPGKTARHLVTFEFKVNRKGHHVTAEQQITAKHADQLRYGRKVQIRYLPATPDIARLAGEDTDNAVNRWVTIIAVIAMVSFPPLIALGLVLFIYHGRKIPA
jgi:hypothetical protein